MAKDYIILQGTNFADGTNAKVLCIAKNVENESELRQHVVAQFEKVKAGVKDDMPEESFTEDMLGMCYTLTQDCDDSLIPLIYEVYAAPMPDQSVKVNIEWDTDGEDVDLPTECIVEAPYDATTDQIVDKLSNEYGHSINSYSIN